MLPLFKRGNRLFVGVSDPTNTHALDEIKFHTNLAVEPILVDEDSLRAHPGPVARTPATPSATACGDDEGLDNLEVGTRRR